MSNVNDVKNKLKKYYQNASGKQYDFDTDFDANINQSGVRGSKLEELKAKTRAYLTASDAYGAADSNYDATVKGIEERRSGIEGLRDSQLAENNKIAMRQASVAGSNYELLKRYLPEYNAQAGMGNLGAGSGAHTDAYAAYMSALSESASNAADRKTSVMQNYISNADELNREKTNAEREKLSAYGAANKELSSALNVADDAATARAAEQNTAVKDKALSLMAYGANEDGTYRKESIEKAFKYIKDFATDETSADEIIKQLTAETLDNYESGAKEKYDDDPSNDNIWGRLKEGVDMERKKKYSLYFDGEKVDIETSSSAIDYSKLSSEAQKVIDEAQNGDLVKIDQRIYVVDDKGRADTDPRLILLQNNSGRLRDFADRYAYKVTVK